MRNKIFNTPTYTVYWERAFWEYWDVCLEIEPSYLSYEVVDLKSVKIQGVENEGLKEELLHKWWDSISLLIEGEGENPLLPDEIELQSMIIKGIDEYLLNSVLNVECH